MKNRKCDNCDHYKVGSNHEVMLISAAIFILFGVMLIPFFVGIPLLAVGLGFLAVDFFKLVPIECLHCRKRFTREEYKLLEKQK